MVPVPVTLFPRLTGVVIRKKVPAGALPGCEASSPREAWLNVGLFWLPAVSTAPGGGWEVSVGDVGGCVEVLDVAVWLPVAVVVVWLLVVDAAFGFAIVGAVLAVVCDCGVVVPLGAG